MEAFKLDENVKISLSNTWNWNALNYNKSVLGHIFNVLQLTSNTGCQAQYALKIIKISTLKKFNHIIFHY